MDTAPREGTQGELCPEKDLLEKNKKQSTHFFQLGKVLPSDCIL